MQLKPIAERTNWPIISAFVVWLLAIAAMSFSRSAYLALTVAAIVLFACQVAFNARRGRSQ